MTHGTEELLYMYASDTRPLHEQELLDILAAPTGAHFRFRCQKRHVEQRTLDTAPHLPGRRLLLHFSLEQPAHFHHASFIPVRQGLVRGLSIEGDSAFLDFTAGRLTTLAEPLNRRYAAASRVQAYTDLINSSGAPCPYGAYLGIGPSVFLDADAALDADDEVLVFQRITRYLAQTVSYRDARFYRFAGLRERGSDMQIEVGQAGSFELRAGRTYDLRLFHFQSVEIDGSDIFDLSADGDLVRFIGTPRFEIGSRYDFVELPIHVRPADRNEALETTLHVTPRPPARGPRLALNFRIEPPRGRLLASAVATAMLVVLLGSLSAVEGGGWWKVAVAVAAAIAIALLQFAGLYVTALGSVRPTYGEFHRSDGKP